MEDIKAIDIMNYPYYCLPEEREIFFKWDEFRIVRQTTFRVPDEKVMGYFGVPSLEAMLKEMDESGYDKVIITAVKMWSHRRHSTHIMDWSIELIKDLVDKSNGRIVGGVSYNPFNIEESISEIDKAIKEYGFKYIYFHSLGYGLPPNDKKYYPLYVKALEYDIPVGFQVGHSAEILPSEVGRPIYVDEVAIDFPGVKFILSHTGWPWVDEWIAMVWKHSNVYGDISAYPARALPERDKLIEFMNSWRGEDKILFGTNGLGLKRCKE